MKGTLGGVALLLCSLATPSAAQVASPLRANWFMKDLRSGMCVQFLVSPGAAQHEAGGLSVVPIERVAERFPALARVAAAEATYQGWVPAEYCWFLYRSAVVKGKVVENDRGSRPVMIGYLAIEGEGLPDSATAIAVSVFTNMSPLSSALNQARLQVDRIDFTIGPIPTEESSLTRSRYEAQHSGATVQWEGGMGGERTPEVRSVRLIGFTGNSSIRGIRANLTPDSAFVASGNLRVVGNGTLKRLLSDSPIRLITPYIRGGDADWAFGL